MLADNFVRVLMHLNVGVCQLVTISLLQGDANNRRYDVCNFFAFPQHPDEGRVISNSAQTTAAASAKQDFKLVKLLQSALSSGLQSYHGMRSMEKVQFCCISSLPSSVRSA